MIALSLSDLKLITELSTLSEFEMLSIHNEDLMAKYLFKCGIDTDFPIVYTANLHRNLQNQVVMGYRVCGETRCDPEFKNSYLAGITDHLVISSYKDVTLMEELAELSYKVRDFTEYLNDSDSLEWDEERALFPDSQLEENWQEQEEKIQELNDILVSIRGPAYNAAGALKSAQEYKAWAEEREFYQEKYDV